MEPKKTARRTRTLDSVGSSAPVAEPVKANPSAHVIDLRQSGGAAPAPAPAPEPMPKPVARPHRAPARKPAPKVEVAPEPPVADFDAQLELAGAPADFDAPMPAQRRFWPAFWRFLLLLILLGLVIAGGAYIYLNYYRG